MNEREAFVIHDPLDERFVEVARWLAEDEEHRRVMWTYDEDTKVFSGFVFTEAEVAA